ncbi:hypothetical protein LXA43DRAFT_923646 [Ganoderma leucocontextum]|nr:hypothetical protein LXA43DRAFT_923646 [Ganoderma leucocontextum]
MFLSNVLFASLLTSALQLPHVSASRSSLHSSHARRSLAFKRDHISELLQYRDLLSESSIASFQPSCAPFFSATLFPLPARPLSALSPPTCPQSWVPASWLLLRSRDNRAYAMP